MKKFENPEIELIKFEVEDVLTVSGTNLGENQTPTAPPRG